MGTSINNPDTDSDSLPDGWEVKSSLDPLSPGDANLDADNDNLSNINEFKYDSDPNNPDTDSDTYPDGLEVSNTYSPTGAGGARLEIKLEGEPTNPAPAAVIETGDENSQSEDTTGGRDQKRKSHIKTIELALELYYDDNSLTYPESLTSLVPEYLIELPKDPLSPQYEYVYERLVENSYQLKTYLEQADDVYDLKDGQADHYYVLTINN